MTEQTLAVLRARNRAFRWPKGVSGNPDGQSRVYHECRRLARAASPAMMKVLIDLAADAEADQRVRSVCAVAVLDRAGIRPIDKPEAQREQSNSRFDASKYTVEELEFIGEALTLMLEDRSGRPAAASKSQLLPPDDEDGSE